jgi:hypothetical protein
MRHARAAALDELEPMLAELRSIGGLTERSRGVFYRGSRAFLHFHEDPTGTHVDVRLTDDFERHRVQSRAEQRAVVTRVRAAVAGSDPRR